MHRFLRCRFYCLIFVLAGAEALGLFPLVQKMNNLEKEVASVRGLLQENPVFLQSINDIENSIQSRSPLEQDITSQVTTLQMRSSVARIQSRIINGRVSIKAIQVSLMTKTR